MRLSKIEQDGVWFHVTLSENNKVIRDMFFGSEEIAIDTANEWEHFQPLTIDTEFVSEDLDVQLEAA